jgi:hypothetical protein
MSTTNPDPKTALLMDALLKNMDQTAGRQNALLAAAEFGLGAPDVPRPLDLAFGCIPFQAGGAQAAAGPARDPITLSKGVARLGVALDPPEVTSPQQALYGIDQSTPVSLAGLGSVLGSKPVQDVYAFGAVLLVAAVSTNTSGSVVTATKTASVQTRWARGGANNTGGVLLVRRDFGLADAVDCLQTGAVTIYTGDITVPYLTLMRFVLSVDRYDPSDAARTRVAATALLDERTARGWGGFCEENMASALVPTLVNSEAQAVKQAGLLADQLKALMTVWVTLDWSPDFKTYWESGDAPFPLPARLKAYLNAALDLGLT